MQKKKYILIIGIIAIVLFAGIQFFKYQNQNEVKEDTMAYLSERGYDVENDIQEAEVYKIMERTEGNEAEFKGNYEVAIIFEDEPDVTYFYAYKRGTNEIQQFNILPMNNDSKPLLKHRESEQVQVL